MALPMVARDEIDQTASFNSNTSSFSSIGGTLRRSLRQMNPFKTRLFRLPATPRLARAKKGLSRGEESTTGWNFERPLSTCVGSISVGRQNGAQMYASIMSNAENSLSATPDSLSMTVPSDSPAHLRHLKPPGEVGGSCRVRTRHTRPPLPSYNPPNAKEAENMIHEHLQNLMVASPRPLQRQFLYLPETSYASNGEVYNANWKRVDGRYRNDQPPISPTHSTVSLLNTSRQAMRSMSYGAKDEPVHRPHLNGLFHQPSLRSLIPTNELHNLSNPNNSENINNQLVFSFSEFAPENAETVFLGREWLFKELHQLVMSEQNTITLIRGASGSGKSAIMQQLALHSPFYSTKQTNGDTVDSGIVVGSHASAESTLSSRNYEWLKMLGKEVCAYLECHLFNASTCSIPEFVRNLASHFMASPSLREYANIVHADKQLMNLLQNESHSLLCSPIKLFRQLIIEPRCKIDEKSCVLIVIDAIDEAEFHRNENAESIAWLIKNVSSELPKYVRWIVSASSESLPFAPSESRSIWIDNDVELDQRVACDMRLLIDYRIATNPSLGRCLRERSSPPSNLALVEFVDEVVRRAKGNALFIMLLMDLIEQERIHIQTTATSLLPSDLSQLYLLYFNSVFTSIQQFHGASTILSVVLASLRPLTFEQLYQIINSAQSDMQISIKDLEKRLLTLHPFITKLNSGAYVLIHNSLRDWLLNGSNHTDYLVNVRYGHILHALYFVHQKELTFEQIYELGHHLLKANPHKYMPREIAPNMPNDRDAQVKWLQTASGHRLQLVLLYERNIYYPNSKVSRLLLMAGASSTVYFADGDTLLCKYSAGNNAVMIQLLIQYNADVNACNQSNGLTPLMYAVKNKHLQAAQLLLQCGADVTAQDRENKSALVHAASVNSVELFALIFETEWPLEHEQSDDKANEVTRAFQEAVKANNIELCTYILDKTDIPIDLSTALMVACCSRKVDVCSFLLSRGATMKAEQRWEGKSALLCAIQSGLFELTKNLLNTPNLKINTEVTSEGWTPLIMAAHYGHNGLVEELLNQGCFIDSQDVMKVPAIGHSILNEHFSIASLLIKKGCNIQFVDNQGNSLLHMLALHFNKQLIERLLELGLQVDAKNSNGLRPVELAIMSGNKQNSVDLFLRRGARLRSVTWQIAAQSNPDYVITLIDKLFNDGRTLHRRSRTSEALQRFNHALHKCNEFLQEDSSNRLLIQAMNTSIKSIDSINNNVSLSSIRQQLRFLKTQILYTLASIHQQSGEYNEALNLSAEALCFADSEAATFQIHFFRARLFFDNQDITNAHRAARYAESIRPNNKELTILLNSLTTPLES